MTIHQARVLPRTGVYAAPIVGRCVNPVTGAPAAMRPGDIGLLQREDYHISYETVEDQESWPTAVGESDRPLLEENADTVIRLTLDMLRAEGFIENGLSTSAQHPRPGKCDLGNDELHSASPPIADTDGSLAQTTTGNTPLPVLPGVAIRRSAGVDRRCGMWVGPGRKEYAGCRDDQAVGGSSRSRPSERWSSACWSACRLV
jgi:hypothetical protein